MSPPTYFARTVASFAISAVFLTAAMPTLAHADEPTANGKLLLTGGVSQVEGSAGGGLAPWGVIGGYGTGDKIDGSVHGTYIHTQDFSIGTYGVAIGVADRVELTMARQTFDTRDAGLQLGLGRGFKFNQDILGVKARVFGDAVLDEDTWMPQVSVGVQLKHDEQGSVVESLGAHSDSGADFYASATKLLLAQRVLLNATVRATKANQFGLLGFGGDKSNTYHAEFEGSAAYLVTRQIAVGAEYRTKPDNLSFAREQNAYDVFAAWAPSKHISLTLAYVSLGDIATFRNQRGVYASLQAGF